MHNTEIKLHHGEFYCERSSHHSVKYCNCLKPQQASLHLEKSWVVEEKSLEKTYSQSLLLCLNPTVYPELHNNLRARSFP